MRRTAGTRSAGFPAAKSASEGAVRPPGMLLAGACVPAVAGFILLFGGGFGLWVAGYLVATLGCVGFVATYRYVDNHRALEAEYISSDALKYLEIMVLLVGLLIALANAFRVATELAKIR